MSNHTVDIVETWVRAFVDVYTLLIIAWIISSWVRLPYNVWVGRIRTFLDDTVQPVRRRCSAAGCRCSGRSTSRRCSRSSSCRSSSGS